MRAVMAMVLAAVAVLFGCFPSVTMGNKAITDEAVLSKIVEKQTTRAEVDGLLGRPAVVDFEDGNEKWVYSYLSQPSAFSGNTVHNLTILFDNAGVVQKVGRGETETRVGR